ncbi:MAG: ATP-binding cassette domain-containing protein [Desulfobulbaceae bacterium]|nr:ATP-binding cassette domain-containing protein [Candidatus Kapabacteria bacterium]MBS4000534.1 ATP-binding cassette domain-containing protein [Desulfobulbaceae bacterium]
MEDDFIIEAQNITVRYGELTVLEDVNFKIRRGEIFVIVGGSGCGKSTLLRQLIGLEVPTEGQILIEGENLSEASQDDSSSIMKKFGILFQSNGLFASMTIGENVKLALDSNTSLDEETADRIIDIKLNSVGLINYKNFYPSEISGGMQKRAALARAMALDPDILFFDEPSSGLDPLTASALDKLIIELNAGLNTTMVIITHDLASILTISHRVLMLDKSVKGVITEGKPEELLNMKENELVYNFFNRIPMEG